MFRKSKANINITLAEDISFPKNTPDHLKSPVSSLWEEIAFKVLSFLILYFLLNAIGSAINSLLDLEILDAAIPSTCFIISLCGLFVFYNKKWSRILLIISFVIFCFFCYYNYKFLLDGGKDFLNHAVFYINYYYQSNIPLFKLEMDQEILSRFFSFLLFIIGGFLSFGIIHKLRPSIPISVSAVTLIGGLMIGRLPNEVTLLTFFFCCFVIISMNGWQPKESVFEPGIPLKAGLITGIFFLLCIFFSLHSFSPKYSPKLRSYHDALVETEALMEQKILSGDLYYDIFYSGRFSFTQGSPGTLSNQSPRYNDTGILEVSLESEPKGNLYLKGWAGSDYNGRGWDSIDEEAFYKTAENWQLSSRIFQTLDPTATALLIQDLGYTFADNMKKQYPFLNDDVILSLIEDNNPPSMEISEETMKLIIDGSYEETVKVTPLQREKNITYAPYFCKYDNPLSSSSVFPTADGYIYTPGEITSVYNGYPFYPFPSPDVSEKMNLFEKIKILNDYNTSPEEALTVQKLYLAYINEIYTKIPEEGLTSLKEICESRQLTDVEDITNFIAAYLQLHAVYSLDLSPLPLTEDFVDYFLFQQKKGFCTHFASSAVLMYRMFGIPARYASGYIVRQSEFKKNEENRYEAFVPDRNSHAWAEIYIENIGWIPVDFTPGYDNFTAHRPDSSQNSSNAPFPGYLEGNYDLNPEQNGPETSPLPDAAEDPDAAGANRKAGALPEWLLKIIYRVCGLAALFFLLLLRRFVILYKRKRLIKMKNYDKAIQGFSHNLYAILKTTGIVKRKYKNDWDYCDEMCKKLAFLAPNSLSRYMDFARFVTLCQKSFFDINPLNHDEFLTSYEIYRRVVTVLSERQTGIKKFYWKYIRCFS